MADLVTTGMIGAIAYPVVQKILGPTAEYIGVELKGQVERGHRNLGRIFLKAQQKLGPRLEEPGGVPPRVLKGILQEGAFCEDELAAEYFGGVLASSRSSNLRDDRGAAMIGQVSRLSTYQLRTHYLVYKAIRELFLGRVEEMGTGRQGLELFVPYEAYLRAMDFSAAEGREWMSILQHCFNGLHGEALAAGASMGSRETLTKYPRRVGVTGDGIVLIPTLQGAELFLWAHGISGALPRQLLDPALVLDGGPAVPALIGASRSREESTETG